MPIALASQSNGGEAIGTIIPRVNDSFKSESEKKKYLLCDGSSFNATEYPKLAALIGTTLPDLRGQFLQGAYSLADANKRIEAGLPNITGLFTHINFINPSGAFYYNGFCHWTAATEGVGDATSYVRFDASRSNPIYGRSTTVQPPALTVRYYIRAK